MGVAAVITNALGKMSRCAHGARVQLLVHHCRQPDVASCGNRLDNAVEEFAFEAFRAWPIQAPQVSCSCDRDCLC